MGRDHDPCGVCGEVFCEEEHAAVGRAREWGAMTHWTDEDTVALAAVAGDIERHCDFPDVGEATLISRAATEIRRLQARVEERRAGAEGLVVSYQRRIAYQAGLIADLSRRLDTLEAERAEVAGELRGLHTDEMGGVPDLFGPRGGWDASDARIDELAARLERKGSDG